MSARHDQSEIITFAEPLPEAGQPTDVRAQLAKIITILEGILTHGGIEAALSDELPGLEREAFKRTKARGTQTQVVCYCIELGLRREDGDWFFNKCEGCGWKNGGKAIMDWKATVRAWKGISVFPSQKMVGNNGRMQPKELSVIERKRETELERMMRESKE